MVTKYTVPLCVLKTWEANISVLLRDKGGISGNTEGMGMFILAPCSLNTQSKLVNMEMTGWREYIRSSLLFQSSRDRPLSES